eukprot:m.204539 g.204539  ORF g.204539 m.204539 type:complete len:64 (-) comp15392_c0_seq4:171-362(-)
MFLIVIFCLVSDPLLCAARGGATEDVKYEYASAVPDSNDPTYDVLEPEILEDVAQVDNEDQQA